MKTSGPQLPDVRCERSSNLVMVEPISRRAKAWVEANVQVEPWQWLGQRFAADAGMVSQMLEGMRTEGLRVA